MQAKKVLNQRKRWQNHRLNSLFQDTMSAVCLLLERMWAIHGLSFSNNQCWTVVRNQIVHLKLNSESQIRKGSWFKLWTEYVNAFQFCLFQFCCVKAINISVCIWMNWTQGHHVSKCAFSVRTHLAVESNFSYVPSGVFQLDFSNHEKSWKTTILHLLQIIRICCNIVTPQNLFLFHVLSPPGYELCLLQPEKLPTLAKKVPSSKFDINTAVEVGKFLVEAVDTLTCPLFEESRLSTKMAHLGILQILYFLQSISNSCFVFLLMSSVWHLFRTPSKRHSRWPTGGRKVGKTLTVVVQPACYNTCYCLPSPNSCAEDPSKRKCVEQLVAGWKGLMVARHSLLIVLTNNHLFLVVLLLYLELRRPLVVLILGAEKTIQRGSWWPTGERMEGRWWWTTGCTVCLSTPTSTHRARASFGRLFFQQIPKGE